MHTLRCKAPAAILRSFVRVYAERKIQHADSIIKELVPAHLEQVLEFQLGERVEIERVGDCQRVMPSIAALGSHVEPGFSVFLKKNVLSFGIFFQPDGLSRLFRFPVSVLSHKLVSATDLLGERMNGLHAQLGECSSFGQRVEIVERFLLARAAANQSDDCDCIGKVSAHFFSNHGVVRVSDAAADLGLSVRQFQRKFLQTTGLTPKTFARVARFQTALDTKLLFPNSSWLDVAHSLEYFDQMHMVRDFHQLAGTAPNRILASIGDGRPTAMGEFNAL